CLLVVEPTLRYRWRTLGRNRGDSTPRGPAYLRPDIPIALCNVPLCPKPFPDAFANADTLAAMTAWLSAIQPLGLIGALWQMGDIQEPHTPRVQWLAPPSCPSEREVIAE